MRIQHNISAMNSYRNYNNNAKALSSNLEKLSSGYKINRAGDDAAGLAISEKMRAQISGLSQAQRNVKDGISLVKTAEGALQEVQDMMNRMVTLATQSANGTYDNKVDRANLQKEVDALKSEIDRIADSSNFNGQKLLDGSLDEGGMVSGAGSAAGAIALETDLAGAELVIKDVAATKGTYTNTAFGAGDIKDGETIELTVALNNGKNVTISLTAKDNTDGTAGGKLLGADGTEYGSYAAGAGTGPTAQELGKAMTAAMKESALGKDFKIADNKDGTFTMTNKVAGADAPQVMKDFNIVIKNADGTKKSEATNALAGASKQGVDAYQTIDADQLTEYDGTKDTVLTIDGKQFAVLVQDGKEATATLMKKAMEAGVELIMVSDIKATNGAGAGDGALHLDAYDAQDADGTNNVEQKAASKGQGDTIAVALSKALGYNVSFELAKQENGLTDADTDVKALFAFKKDTTIDPNAQAGKGLTLQIGDTAEEYNQLKVSVGDMHTKALGLKDLDISNIKGAQEAIETIKTAINTVSSTRGDLGAIQNRLEHTQNNLSVMQENIQDAESTIRDTDVADEMTAYTKNNILLQSAQAMLAQANQMPQGVLQLLQ